MRGSTPSSRGASRGPPTVVPTGTMPGTALRPWRPAGHRRGAGSGPVGHRGAAQRAEGRSRRRALPHSSGRDRPLFAPCACVPFLGLLDQLGQFGPDVPQHAGAGIAPVRRPPCGPPVPASALRLARALASASSDLGENFARCRFQNPTDPVMSLTEWSTFCQYVATSSSAGLARAEDGGVGPLGQQGRGCLARREGVRRATSALSRRVPLRLQSGAKVRGQADHLGPAAADPVGGQALACGASCGAGSSTQQSAPAAGQ